MRTRRTIVAAVLAGAVGAAGFGAAGTAGAATVLHAKLSGQAEVPLAGAGTGTARVVLKAHKRQICFNIRLEDVGEVAAGHIHKGGRGVAGPIFVPLFDELTEHPEGCASASRTKIRKIREHPRRYYVNVHNATYPAGAARGQLHR
jgi:hypothetical protein